MKKMRMVSLILVLSLCTTFLTGCMGAIGKVKINEDGSGSVTVSAGMSKKALDMMASMEGSEVDLTELTAFTYNGVEYYGDVESTTFDSVEDFNNAMLADILEDSTNGVDSGTLTLEKNKDGSFTLNLVVLPQTGDTTELEESMSSGEYGDMAIDEEMLEAVLSEFIIAYEFEFPTAVIQIAGPSQGITIKGNTVSMNLMELETRTESTTYIFTTSDKLTEQVFSDVSPKSWYYEAVNALADGGLVNGMGNGKFAPEDILTYAQFCQILARAKGLDVGEENGYWAYNAIESCITEGYIENRGDIVPENYNVAISREAAVAAMYRSKQSEFEPTNFMPIIPDYDSISEMYQYDILNAYKYGITHGMDDAGTFNPQGQLTRAQVCQLFYNLNWCSASELGINEPISNGSGSGSSGAIEP